jgi:hypothetical protein
MSAIDRATLYLATCEASIAKQGGHGALFKAAAVLTWGFAIDPTNALPLLAEYNTRSVPPWPERELMRKLDQTRNWKKHKKPRGHLLGDQDEHGSESYPSPGPLPPIEPAWPEPDLGQIDKIVRNGPGLYPLWEHSPVRYDDNSSHAEDIIDYLLPGDPLLCVGKTNYLFATRRREAWRGHLGRLPLIVPNPMLAPIGRTQDGRYSEHSLEATARRVYQVIEFDFSPGDDGRETIWAPLLQSWRCAGINIADACASLLLHLREQLSTLACVCHSGGKSLHAWFRVFELTEAAQKNFMREAVSLGADRATFTRSQFVRIPDGLRNNGSRQTCYYLDPREAVKT